MYILTHTIVHFVLNQSDLSIFNPIQYGVRNIRAGGIQTINETCTQKKKKPANYLYCVCDTSNLDNSVATKIFEDLGGALCKAFIIGWEPVSSVHYTRPGTCINRSLH